MVKYLFEASKNAEYATGLKVSRWLLLWLCTPGINLVGASLEYAKNGHSFVGWLLLLNAIAPALVFIALAYKQRENLKV